MKKLVYLAKWFFGARFLGRKRPLQTVLFVTDACSLSCRHCAIYNHRNPVMKSYRQIEDELRYSYNQGSRFVDFEGGEPLLWKEGGLDINSLVDLAKAMGFYSCTITTNAQQPMKGLKADSIWVSLDGIGAIHDDIRGEGAFAKLEKNIAESDHKAISVNMTINNRNYNNVEEVVKYVKKNPHLRLVSFSFHTPYEGTEHLFLDWERRADVVDRLIELKKHGAPIMNSVSGLKKLRDNSFKKHCWVSNFILHDGTKFDECVGKTAGVCDRCGFGMAGEMSSVFEFKPDTLLAGMKLRIV
ncbi:MAG: radical SAM protein [Bacteroidales bacterium]|nr:radical SAM protein [Bacteroidales bacterium]